SFFGFSTGIITLLTLQSNIITVRIENLRCLPRRSGFNKEWLFGAMECCAISIQVEVQYAWQEFPKRVHWKTAGDSYHFHATLFCGLRVVFPAASINWDFARGRTDLSRIGHE